MITKYLIEFKKQTGVPVYYAGQFSGMGQRYFFCQAVDLADKYETKEAAEQVIATLPMAEVLQAVEHQFGE